MLTEFDLGDRYSPEKMDALEREIERAAALIEAADALIIAAGAGMGVDSGLPDFRGNDGFWKAYPALAEANIEFYSIACPDEFHRNRRRAGGFYGHRLNLYRNTVPHEGFEILKRWAEPMLHGCSVFTSNVDGQFQKAGFDPRDVREYHGSIHHLQCLTPCSRDTRPAGDFDPMIDVEACDLLSELPRCSLCGELARPNVLLFGDRDWSSDVCSSDLPRPFFCPYLSAHIAFFTRGFLYSKSAAAVPESARGFDVIVRSQIAQIEKIRTAVDLPPETVAKLN